MKKAIIIGIGLNWGLGDQLAKRFAAEGLHVYAARNQANLDALISEIEKSEKKAAAVRTDATDEIQKKSLFYAAE